MAEARKQHNPTKDELEEMRTRKRQERIESQLRANEDLFRAIFELSAIGMILVSVDKGEFLKVNRRFAEMTGYSAEELTGKVFTDITHPEDVEACQTAFHRMVVGLPSYFNDKRYIRKDGSTLWVTISASPVYGRSGEMLGIVSSVQDISAHKNTETKLIESEARKSAILDSALDCIITVDHMGRILEFNQSAEREFGYKKSAVLGKEMAELILPPQYRETIRTGLERYLNTGTGIIFGQRVEMLGQRFNGEQFPMELSVSRVPIDGPPVFTGFFRNITERRAAQDELRRANETLESRVQQRTLTLTRTNAFLSSLIENIPNMIVVMDAKDLRFVGFNKAGEDLLGYSRNQLMGKTVYDFFPKEDADFYTAANRAAVETGTTIEIPEEEIHTTNKGRRILRSKKIPIYDLKGHVEYILAISEDITEMKKAEETRIKLIQERQARIEAEKAVQLRDDFLSIASHELRTPLTPIRMYLQLLKQTIETTSPSLPKAELLRKAVQGADKEFERFLALVENLLDVSRIDAGRLLLSRSVFDLSVLVQTVLARFQNQLQAVHCDLRLNIQENVVGNWDQSRIEQVVINLLSNAMKYGANKPIEISLRKKHGLVVLKVKDHGIGISKDDYEKIYSRFERVAPLKNYSGFGLGLFITREIVRAHNGTIKLESEIGVGSTFTVELPE